MRGFGRGIHFVITYFENPRVLVSGVGMIIDWRMLGWLS